MYRNIPVNSPAVQRKDACSGSDSQNAQPGVAVARKRRVHAQFNDLQECYLQKRRYRARQAQKQEERICNPVQREGYHPGLKDFQSVLSSFTRYSRLQVVAELRHGDLFHSANIVSSIEFDRDDEFFATAGVSRRIKIFEFASVMNENADVQCPIVEMPTRSKLSCLSWNKYTKNHIASSDYDGIVTVWDVTTCQSVMEYEEHEKRAWSVDFSRTEPTLLVSGSDDCQVKIWSTKQEASVLNIDMKANICSVKYNPGSSFHVAVRSFQLFEESSLVKIDCRGMHASDYKKLGAKLKELVPCVLLSFDDEQIMIWRGHGWKSMYHGQPISSSTRTLDNLDNDPSCSDNTEVGIYKSEIRTSISSPRMTSLWRRAIDSSKAMLLEDISLGPDDLLKVVEEFETISQVTEHSYPAVMVSNEESQTREDDYDSEDEDYFDDEYLDFSEKSAPPGSLPVDFLVDQFGDGDE